MIRICFALFFITSYNSIGHNIGNNLQTKITVHQFSTANIYRNYPNTCIALSPFSTTALGSIELDWRGIRSPPALLSAIAHAVSYIRTMYFILCVLTYVLREFRTFSLPFSSFCFNLTKPVSWIMYNIVSLILYLWNDTATAACFMFFWNQLIDIVISFGRFNNRLLNSKIDRYL